jgi:hypothetical protein
MSGLKTIFFILLIAFSMIFLGCATIIRKLSKTDEEEIAKWEKFIVSPQSIKELAPIGFITTSTKTLKSPNWVTKDIGRVNRHVGRVCGLFSYFGPGLYVYCGLPVAISAGVIVGEVTEHKWKPTIQSLQQELKENDPAIVLTSAFETMFSRYNAPRPINLNQVDDPFGQAKQQGLKSVFQTEIVKIELSECDLSGTFGVAVTIRTRLWETASNNLLYDTVSRYSNGAFSKKPFFIGLS